MHPLIASGGENTEGVFILSTLLGWIIFSIIAGAIARNKGNSAIVTFFVSLVLSPLVGIAVALVQKPNEKVVEKRRLRTGTVLNCPFCAELIKTDARVCRYCGRDIPPPDAAMMAAVAVDEAAQFNRRRRVIRLIILVVLALAFVAFCITLVNRNEPIASPHYATLTTPVYVDNNTAYIPAGTNIELLSRDGPNAHIRYGNREFFVPSSAVTQSK
jgi:hypothetical protein